MIGFIGCGNMASAMVKGVCSSGLFEGEKILLYDIDEAKARALSKSTGARTAWSLAELLSASSMVVLAVKPNALAPLLSEIDPALKSKDPLIVSVAAGKTLEFIAGCLSYEPVLVRVMPNINAAALAAVSAYCGNARADESMLELAEKFCSCFGKAVALDESFFPIFGVIGGCSPAFAYMFIDAMARAAVKNGMPKAKALEISAQAVLGSAKMVLESGESPWNLVDMVCSPGGTTVEGVLSLQKDGFEAAVAAAVQAAVDKDKKI